MKRSFALVAFLLIALFALAVSCGSSGEPASSSNRVSSEGLVGVKDSLGFGTDEKGALVTVVAVENDSRCPEGVQCVRAGEAFVVLSTTVDTNDPVESRLEIVPGGQASVDIGRVTVTILELRPDPPPQSGVLESAYTVFLRVEEN